MAYVHYRLAVRCLQKRRWHGMAVIRLNDTLAAGNQLRNSSVFLAGKVHRASKGLEQALDHVMWFASIQQFEMQIAARLIGEALKKLPGETKSKRRRHILILFLGCNLPVGH